MKEPVPSAAAAALDELLEVSPQVDAAVILERDGGALVASAPASFDRSADQLGATCVRILEAAEQSRRELGREPVSQVEVGTPDGHVFVVGDPHWVVAAVTDADPTVGLVFYDLKSALRSVREAVATDSPATNGTAPVSLVTSTGDDDRDGDEATASGDDAVETNDAPPHAPTTTQAGDAGSNGSSIGRRWRRRGR